jgi:hypothetical protein
MDAAALASWAASTGFWPCASANKKAPANVSPAPVGSLADTLNVPTRSSCPWWKIREPSAPRVTTTMGTSSRSSSSKRGGARRARSSSLRKTTPMRRRSSGSGSNARRTTHREPCPSASPGAFKSPWIPRPAIDALVASSQGPSRTSSATGARNRTSTFRKAGGSRSGTTGGATAEIRCTRARPSG